MNIPKNLNHFKDDDKIYIEFVASLKMPQGSTIFSMGKQK